ncbi:hypothetical protein [Actinopolymorpha rutila]|uniref:Uncharacterized protein n=1 Tax=Actinopolymorpha rutila TaxID=446787 RepID=A0A852ZTY7_9ACTN|nr:hypothetical protein [Actinopolymorpha rutila]NYH92460.1 hypothetical protein [Actinopolymorpha rutila]
MSDSEKKVEVRKTLDANTTQAVTGKQNAEPAAAEQKSDGEANLRDELRAITTAQPAANA